jgi:uncharacterized membrane protein
MGSGRLPTSKRAGIILGLGMGGLVDGILLHQIVQWHSMGSAVVPPTTMEAMRDNMRWDGFFHAAVGLLILIGVYWPPGLPVTPQQGLHGPAHSRVGVVQLGRRDH